MTFPVRRNCHPHPAADEPAGFPGCGTANAPTGHVTSAG
jgi:hypothetical protein